MPGAPPPSSGTPRASKAKFWDVTVWGLCKNPVGTGPAGSVLGDNSLYRETRGTHIENISLSHIDFISRRD